eukprot:TRINITY_DN13076_c0_g1_i1.p1 TRINITY_DN13076_c0_g1~~TRINITY_DN13076_c0_g1_i1.p1  ORF type:complete len:792 (-),score=290.26 TRINITY_DN13076_c0_g1_i1:145-2520(-)
MSQPTLTSFFQARKHCLPEQQAAKKRKIVLEKHQIQDILDNEDSDHSESSEEEFEECLVTPEAEEKDVENESDKEEFKDCIDPDVLENPDAEAIAENDKSYEFIEDSDWEQLANDTLDATVPEESDILELVQRNSSVDNAAARSSKSEEKADVPLGRETVSSVVTSALDNHRTLPRHHLVSVGSSSSYELGTPSPNKKSENFRKSKKDEKEGKWTPKKVSEPLFTVGYRDQPAKSAKKKLNLSEKSKNVVFQKLSSLSPSKKVQEKYSSPRKIDYENLGLRLTPQKSMISPFKKPGFSKNLFSESPEKCSPVKPDLTKAIQAAKTLQAKLTPAEVKAKLGKVKLRDLKSRLASLSSSSLKVAEIKAKTTCIPPKIPSSITLQLDVPCSPSKRIPASPLKASHYKASPRKVPAYQRFHNLARPADRTLPLPYSYRMLGEVFRCTDTVVSMLNNRKEIINLDKVSKSVTDLMQKKWNVKYLQQIFCVFPQAYKLAWERAQGRFGTNTEKKELQMRPNMAYKKDLMGELDGRIENYVKMMPEHLVERRDIFRNSLVEMVKDHHEEFLATLDPPIVANRNALTSWHKDFDVDAAPEVDTVELPEEPGKVKAEVIVKEMMGKAAGFAGVNPKLSDALLENSFMVEDMEKKAAQFSSPSKASATAGLQGLNPTLIAKIKAKEAARAKLEMTRNPEQIKRLSQLKKLPELARMIRSLFITEKKAALEVQLACKRLTSSLPHGTEKTQVEENMRLLAVESRGWLKIHLVGSAEYFKMDKTDINKVCKKLEQKLKDEQEM